MRNLLQQLEVRRLFAAGDADLSFGTGGVITEIPGQNLNVNRTALLPNDKLLIAGAIAPVNFGDFDYMLRQYSPDGTLDSSFGENGTAQGRFRGTSTRLRDMYIAADGKILALGFDDEALEEMIVARFNADGSLDNTFSGDGFLVRPSDTSAARIMSMPDGRVVVATQHDVIRFTAAGALDNTFGNAGVVEDVATFIGTIAVLSDGAVLVGGGAVNASESTALSITKLNANGAIDSSFGDNGTVTTDLDGPSTTSGQFIRDITVLPDGSILALGESNLDMNVVKYQSNGDIDASFGDQGTNSFISNSSSYRVFVDDEGRIYLTDFSGGATRLSSDGDLDPSFGRVIFGESQGILALAAGITSTGRLIAAGDQGSVSPPRLMIVSRLTEDDGNPSPITLGGGTVNVAGTGDDDAVYASDFKSVNVTLNNFGRVFEPADVNLISIVGGAGDDHIRLDDVRETSTFVSGGLGSDRITGGRKNDTLFGNGGRDFIDGNWGADLIVGHSGKDQLRGQAGKDRVYGREGNDYVGGENGDDRLRGDGGMDMLVGGEGNDQLFADDDITDSLFGGNGNDTAETDELDIVDSIESIL